MSTSMSTSDPSGTLRCARHPNTETVLRCGRCDTPICARCMVMSPVGARCPTCAQVKRFNLMLKPKEVALAIVYGVGVAAIGIILLRTIPILLLFGLFAYAGLGFLVGDVVSRAANRKRVPALGPIAVACLFVGYELGTVIQLVLSGADVVIAILVAPRLLLAGLPGALIQSPLLGMLVGALLAWMRVR